MIFPETDEFKATRQNANNDDRCMGRRIIHERNGSFAK